MRVALAHVFFNLFGTLIWFPIPMVRRIPLAMARQLGNLAADWRWFPIGYIILMFGLIPLALLGLSLIHWAVLTAVAVPLFLLAISAIVVLVLRNTNPDRLPTKLRSDPAWLPPSLQVQQQEPAPETSESAAAADQDGRPDSPNSASSTPWPRAPAVWSGVWIIIVALMCALPNSQWANIKHSKFDPREHMGIGAWSVCSAQFTSDTNWATIPNPAECTETFLDSCATKKMPACQDTTDPDYIDFSDLYGANKQYESSWVMARSKCSTAQWKEHCLGLKCLGSSRHLGSQSPVGLHRQ
jgi:hypothetical protein